MTAILIALLYLLLYALGAILVLELVLYIVGLFLAVPPKVRQLLYAIIGVFVLLYAIQLLLPGIPHPIK